MIRKVLSLIFLVLVVAACTAAPTTVPAPTATAAPTAAPAAAWWHEAVFYEIFVRSFYDSNADGIGDLKGITARLDYLSQLGVRGLWLMPIQPSPTYHGYDVTDYMAVNPDYGTMDDFKQLLSEAHKRGMRVILDFVANHTSSQHPWFIAAQDPKSDKRDWYVWTDTDPGYAGPFNENVWFKTANGYYYAVFDKTMPDLNYRNPAVTKQMEQVANFWLKDVGIDGFRVDAARHLIEDGKIQVNTPETHAWFKQFFTWYKGINPQAMTVGEVWDSRFAAAQYVQDHELDLTFNFELADGYVAGVNNRNAAQIRGTLDNTLKAYPPNQFGSFLTNHDIDRVMAQFHGDLAKMKTAAVLYLTGPGVPFIYYGEEIGMTGAKPDEQIRTPMQWSADANAGFSSAKPWEAVNADYKDKNVAAQNLDPNSLLPLYRRLVGLRNQHEALRSGDTATIDAGNPGVFAVLRSTPNEAILILLNLTDTPVKDYRLNLAASGLQGSLSIEPLLGAEAGTYAGVTVNAQGGLSDYQPLPQLPPGARLVLTLKPAK